MARFIVARGDTIAMMGMSSLRRMKLGCYGKEDRGEEWHGQLEDRNGSKTVRRSEKRASVRYWELLEIQEPPAGVEPATY